MVNEWRTDQFWISGNETVEYVFGPQSQPGSFAVAAPIVFTTTLRIESTSISNGPGPVGPAGESMSWVLSAVAVNETNGSAWFRFVGIDVG